MTSSSIARAAEIRAYASGVRAALDDIPAERLAELLEDLEEHLGEVLAEDDGSLVSRLGPPGNYAAELRIAARLPAAAPAGKPSYADRLRGDLDRALGPVRASSTGRQVEAFLPELRPAWWVFRAWAGVTAVSVVFFGSYSFPLPTFGIGPLVGPLLTVLAIVWSVRAGLRSRESGLVRDRKATLLNVGLAVAALVAVFGLAVPNHGGSYDEVAYSGDDPASPTTLSREDGTPITNIYPYSTDGTPLSGVLLYDQDGNPIDNLSADGVETAPGSAPQLGNVFPQQLLVDGYDEADDETTGPMPTPVVAPTSTPTTAPAPSAGAPSSSGAPTTGTTASASATTVPTSSAAPSSASPSS